MILVCGEALLDVFATHETPTGIALQASVGGSPFNVAVGLARLGQPVGFMGGISTGFAGERLFSALQREGVDTGAVLRSDAPTTLGLVGLDAAGVPSYAFYGAGCADRLLGIDALRRVPAGTAVVNVGSYATVVEPVASTLRALVAAQRQPPAAHPQPALLPTSRPQQALPTLQPQPALAGAQQQPALVAYDPNVRLNVEPDVDRWRAQLQWMLPRTDLLKVSDEDLALLAPGADLHAWAAAAIAAGVRAVVVTRGAAGALGWTARGGVAVAAPRTAVVDTVGAGDTFQAAWLAWLAENGLLSAHGIAALSGDDLQASMAFAARAAAITCARRGADLPRRAELG